MIDITQYLDKEKLLLDFIKDRVWSYPFDNPDWNPDTEHKEELFGVLVGEIEEVENEVGNLLKFLGSLDSGNFSEEQKPFDELLDRVSNLEYQLEKLEEKS